MECSHIKCGQRSINDDRFLSCFMCGKFAHLKCIGVSGLVLDACLARVGVRWFCHECDPMVVDFMKIRSTALKNMSYIENELKVAQNMIEESTKALKSFGTTKILPGITEKQPKEKVLKNNTLSEAPSVSLLKTPEVIPLLHTPEVTISKRSKKNTTRKTSKKGSIFDISSSDESSSPRPLVVVSPKKKRKTIFISRLASKNTEADVLHYIKTRAKTEDVVQVKKFEFSYPRKISSFKVTIPEALYEELIDAKFWPPNAFVREFEFKSNSAASNIAELPSAEINGLPNVSKN